jgi:hypothetical protein
MAKKKTRRIKRNKGTRRGSPSKTPRKNGHHFAKPPDTRLRRLLIPTPRGVREVAIRGLKQASQLGKYWAAVQKYLQTGDDSALLRFKNKSFTDASGNRHLFPTDLKQLDRQASAGVLSFESIYAGGGR